MKMTMALLSSTLLISSTVVMANPADLSTWMSDGGNWSYDSDNNAWTQSQNGNSTFLYGTTDALNNAVSGDIRVDTDSDNDFIGFGIGYNGGDLTNDDADYFLLTWKKDAQGNSERGVALWHVQGALSGMNLFYPNSYSGLTEVGQAATLENQAWTPYQSASFALTYEEQAMGIFIDDSLEYALTPADVGMTAFTSGTFAFFNYSQEDVVYSNVLFDDIGNVIGEDQQDELDDATGGSTDVPITGSSMALAMIALGGWLRRKV